jgi:multicomponent Na+:H+ antiporter subunit F
MIKAFTAETIWEKVLCFASLSTKTSVIMLMISVWRDDYYLGLVAVIILSAGNAGLMLIAHLIKRMNLE